MLFVPGKEDFTLFVKEEGIQQVKDKTLLLLSPKGTESEGGKIPRKEKKFIPQGD